MELVFGSGDFEHLERILQTSPGSAVYVLNNPVGLVYDSEEQQRRFEEDKEFMLQHYRKTRDSGKASTMGFQMFLERIVRSDLEHHERAKKVLADQQKLQGGAFARLKQLRDIPNLLVLLKDVNEVLHVDDQSRQMTYKRNLGPIVDTTGSERVVGVYDFAKRSDLEMFFADPVKLLVSGLPVLDFVDQTLYAPDQCAKLLSPFVMQAEVIVTAAKKGAKPIKHEIAGHTFLNLGDSVYVVDTDAGTAHPIDIATPGKAISIPPAEHAADLADELKRIITDQDSEPEVEFAEMPEGGSYDEAEPIPAGPIVEEQQDPKEAALKELQYALEHPGETAAPTKPDTGLQQAVNELMNENQELRTQVAKLRPYESKAGRLEREQKDAQTAREKEQQTYAAEKQKLEAENATLKKKLGDVQTKVRTQKDLETKMREAEDEKRKLAEDLKEQQQAAELTVMLQQIENMVTKSPRYKAIFDNQYDHWMRDPPEVVKKDLGDQTSILFDQGTEEQKTVIMEQRAKQKAVLKTARLIMETYNEAMDNVFALDQLKLMYDSGCSHALKVAQDAYVTVSKLTVTDPELQKLLKERVDQTGERLRAQKDATGKRLDELAKERVAIDKLEDPEVRRTKQTSNDYNHKHEALTAVKYEIKEKIACFADVIAVLCTRYDVAYAEVARQLTEVDAQKHRLAQAESARKAAKEDFTKINNKLNTQLQRIDALFTDQTMPRTITRMEDIETALKDLLPKYADAQAKANRYELLRGQLAEHSGEDLEAMDLDADVSETGSFDASQLREFQLIPEVFAEVEKLRVEYTALEKQAKTADENAGERQKQEAAANKKLKTANDKLKKDLDKKVKELEALGVEKETLQEYKTKTGEPAVKRLKDTDKTISDLEKRATDAEAQCTEFKEKVDAVDKRVAEAKESSLAESKRKLVAYHAAIKDLGELYRDVKVALAKEKDAFLTSEAGRTADKEKYDADIATAAAEKEKLETKLEKAHKETTEAVRALQEALNGKKVDLKNVKLKFVDADAMTESLFAKLAMVQELYDDNAALREENEELQELEAAVTAERNSWRSAANSYKRGIDALAKLAGYDWKKASGYDAIEDKEAKNAIEDEYRVQNLSGLSRDEQKERKRKGIRRKRGFPVQYTKKFYDELTAALGTGVGAEVTARVEQLEQTLGQIYAERGVGDHKADDALTADLKKASKEFADWYTKAEKLKQAAEKLPATEAEVATLKETIEALTRSDRYSTGVVARAGYELGERGELDAEKHLYEVFLKHADAASVDQVLHAQVLYNLGFNYDQRGKTDDAIVQLEAAKGLCEAAQKKTPSDRAKDLLAQCTINLANLRKSA